MSKEKTISKKITQLGLIVTIFLMAVPGYYILWNEYQTSSQQNIDRAKMLIAGTNLQLQPAIHYKDTAALDSLVNIFSSQESFLYIVIYDAGLNIISSSRDPGINDLPLLLDVRWGLNMFDEGRLRRDDPKTGNKLTEFTFPVISKVSPSNRHITSSKFLKAIADPQVGGSKHLMGYIRLGISEAKAESAFMMFCLKAGLIFLALVAVISLAVMLATRIITAPIGQLAKLADDISLGKLDTVSIQGPQEIQQLAISLNAIIENLATHKVDLDVDNRLLSLKVDERTVELSARNNELNKAISEVTLAKNRLRQLAYFDSLTSLPNRRNFNDQFELLLNIALREQHVLALLFIDIDNFKRINDSLGHNAGDLLLKEIASRLKEGVRDQDLLSLSGSDSGFVFRFGGDEFTIVLNKIDCAESAGIIAERLLVKLSLPMTIEGHEFVVTPSIGIALAPQDGEDIQSLLKHADTAMYNTKSAGKNSYSYYNENMEEADIERLNLETELRRALKNNELELYFQPQVNIETGEIVGAETLLRWEHTEIGYVPPFEFVALAEQSGIMGELGDWVLLNACQHIKAFQDKGLNLPNVSINVSSVQFTNEFSVKLKSILNDLNLEPSSIIVEITEGIIMGNVEETSSRLDDVKQIGVGLSVDDFGTGYSSLAYLTRFPLDELKIDKSFVTSVDKSPENASIVQAIISMGQSLGLDLVAEGVETPEEYDFLKQRGIKVVQGYFFSKPVGVLEFEALLKENSFKEQIEEHQG